MEICEWMNFKRVFGCEKNISNYVNQKLCRNCGRLNIVS